MRSLFQRCRYFQCVCRAGTNTFAALDAVAGSPNIFNISDIDGAFLKATITTGALRPVQIDLQYTDPIEKTVYSTEGAEVTAPESSEEVEENE